MLPFFGSALPVVDLDLFSSMMRLYSLARWRTADPRDLPPPEVWDLDSVVVWDMSIVLEVLVCLWLGC